MRGYGRDYNDRSWFDRAGETVRGWFGGGRGHDYDRDYGGWSDDRDHGSRNFGGGGYDRVNWTDRGNTWNTGGRQQWRGGEYGGGAHGWDRGGDWNRNQWGNNRGSYDRDFGGQNMGTWSAGGSRGYGNAGGYSNQGGYSNAGGYDYDFEDDRGSWNRGGPGGYRNTGYRGGQGGGNGNDEGFYGQSGNYGNRSSFGAGLDWGDYNRGGYGGDLFRNARGGGVEPGRYFRGYGIGSSGGHGYEPY